MSDLMLLKDYAEAVKNRDWYTCDLISDRVEPLLNKIKQLQADCKMFQERYMANLETQKKLEEENNELKIDVENKQAVIKYLEEFIEFCKQCKNPKDDCLC